jgi:hypothetical protein
VHESRCDGSRSCVGLAGRLCSTGVCHQRGRHADVGVVADETPTGERACSSTVWLSGIEKNGKDEADEVAMLQTESRGGADGS